MPGRASSLMSFSEALSWATTAGVRWAFRRDDEDVVLRAELGVEVIEVDSTNPTDWGWMFIHVMRELRGRCGPKTRPDLA